MIKVCFVDIYILSFKTAHAHLYDYDMISRICDAKKCVLKKNSSFCLHCAVMAIAKLRYIAADKNKIIWRCARCGSLEIYYGCAVRDVKVFVLICVGDKNCLLHDRLFM